jgi:hypothetical protein
MIKRLILTTTVLVAGIAISEAAHALEVIDAMFVGEAIKEFDLTGALLANFPTGGSFVAADAVGSKYVSNLGGSAAFRFNSNGFQNFFLASVLPGDTSPFTGALALGPDGNLYLGWYAGNRMNRIERFDVDGTSLGVFATYSGGPPQSMAFDPIGNLYVGHSAINKFSSNGSPLGTFGSGTPVADLAFDSIGNLYVARHTNSIQVFSSNDQFVRFIQTDFSVDSVAFDSNDIMYLGGRTMLGPVQSVIRRYHTDGTLLGNLAVMPGNRVSDLVVVDLVPELSAVALSIGAGNLILLLRFRRRS